MKCECIKAVNDSLLEHNTELDLTFIHRVKEESGKRAVVLESTLAVPTRKIDKKKRTGPIKMLITFCPFCGKKVEEE